MTDYHARTGSFAAVDPVGPHVRVVRLASLALLDIGPGEPDVRGWPVVTNEGQRVGRVRDLLVELATREVRYLDVGLDLAVADGRPDLRLAIPIGCARAGTRRNLVNVRCATREQIRHAPRHSPELLTLDDEIAIRRFYTSGPRGLVVAADGADFYAGADFDARVFWSVRRAGREDVPYLALLSAREVKIKRPVSSADQSALQAEL
jgi:hypothetical protein